MNEPIWLAKNSFANILPVLWLRTIGNETAMNCNYGIRTQAPSSTKFVIVGNWWNWKILMKRNVVWDSRTIQIALKCSYNKVYCICVHLQHSAFGDVFISAGQFRRVATVKCIRRLAAKCASLKRFFNWWIPGIARRVITFATILLIIIEIKHKSFFWESTMLSIWIWLQEAMVEFSSFRKVNRSVAISLNNLLAERNNAHFRINLLMIIFFFD